MISIETANSYSSKTTILGWFAGLAWLAYAGEQQPHWWGWVLLIVVGMFAASIVIGGGFALLASFLTKAVRGSPDASPDFYAWGAFICPVVAFFFAAPVARLLS
ncbi:hypothetical protein [Mesorhizobium sp. ESP-6-2]|uniref:hypothetical protein n=1 Tax=Mesorhizobium sp. ESP-6-2 TaxID=2876625 RepID=UPI001CCB6904|nr:hypothetical protein [Mesorhizobium sp. ESP-6-2]MBZ9806948.1 hypothetical protein [Mesorhizobium sp. ESP-6-2]